MSCLRFAICDFNRISYASINLFFSREHSSDSNGSICSINTIDAMIENGEYEIISNKLEIGGLNQDIDEEYDTIENSNRRRE